MIGPYIHTTFTDRDLNDKGETLRTFFDRHCYRIARLAANAIANDDGIMAPDSLVLSMPVKFVCLGDGYSKVSPLPPILDETIGPAYLHYVDAEYSFIGSYGEWLYHISYTQYDWIEDIKLKDCTVYCGRGLILYDNSSGNDQGEEE